MKLPDTNLLIYAVDESSQHHSRAAEWWNSVMSSGESIALAWVVMLAFLRLTTRAPVMTSPLSVDEAFTIVNRWIDHSSTTIIQPRRRHHQVLQDLLLGVGTGGNLTTDAHLAALAIEHGAVLCTADNDFSRFSGLEWSNPLTGLDS